MEKREIKKLGISTSLLGFGCMRFPVKEDGTINEAEAEAMLDHAIANGVNYIDTAYPYHNGDSEPFVGRVLEKYDRSSYYLATKLPAWQVHSLDDAKRLFHEQLTRLNKDYIDFYLLHAMNRERWESMVRLGVVDYCEQLQREGKIRYFGFSFHDKYEVFEQILTSRQWDFCQIQFNYMDTEEQPGLKGYALAERLQVPLVIMEPVRGGSLAQFSGEIKERFQSMDREASIASFALRWVGTFPNVKVILSGMSAMEQVKDNLKTFAAFRPLSVREQEEIAHIAHMIKSRIQNACTGCRYCMPCPAGVNIPYSFRIWNQYHMYQRYSLVQNNWEKNLSEAQKPKNCIQCGKCEKACPQKISIRQDLKRVQAELDHPVWN